MKCTRVISIGNNWMVPLLCTPPIQITESSISPKDVSWRERVIFNETISLHHMLVLTKR